MPSRTSFSGSSSAIADGSAKASVQQWPARRLAIIGAGTMGRTIAAGVTRAHLVSPENVFVTDRTSSVADALARDFGVTVAPSNAAASGEADIVLLCVKPPEVAAVLDELAREGGLNQGPLLISIAAGVPLRTLQAHAGTTARLVRAMPNTPCRIGRGMTVLTRGTGATDADLELARTLFATMGRCLILDERHFHAVTAVSASGPAFIYLVLEAIAEGGVMCGLRRDIAIELAAQMALGASEMVLTTGSHTAALKDEVTTPGGCTVAGLLALEDGRLRSVLARAVQTTAHAAAGLQ